MNTIRNDMETNQKPIRPLIKLPNGAWVSPNTVTCVKAERATETRTHGVWVKIDNYFEFMPTSTWECALEMADQIANLINQ